MSKADARENASDSGPGSQAPQGSRLNVELLADLWRLQMALVGVGVCSAVEGEMASRLSVVRLCDRRSVCNQETKEISTCCEEEVVEVVDKGLLQPGTEPLTSAIPMCGRNKRMPNGALCLSQVKA